MYEPGTKTLVGAEVVIDKDRASALLAEQLEADLFVMATDVDAVYTGWGTPEQRAIGHTTPSALDGAGPAGRVDGAQGRGGGGVRPQHRQAGGHRHARRAARRRRRHRGHPGRARGRVGDDVRRRRHARGRHERHVTTRQAAFIGVGAMVGAGIFSLLGAAGEVAGRGRLALVRCSPASSPRSRATRSRSSARGTRRRRGCSSTSTAASAPAMSRPSPRGWSTRSTRSSPRWSRSRSASYASDAFAGGSDPAGVKVVRGRDRGRAMTALNIAGSTFVARVQSVDRVRRRRILALFAVVTIAEHRTRAARAVGVPERPGHRLERRAHVLRVPRVRRRHVHGEGPGRPARKQLPRAMAIAIGLATVVYVAVVARRVRDADGAPRSSPPGPRRSRSRRSRCWAMRASG